MKNFNLNPSSVLKAQEEFLDEVLLDTREKPVIQNAVHTDKKYAKFNNEAKLLAKLHNVLDGKEVYKELDPEYLKTKFSQNICVGKRRKYWMYLMASIRLDPNIAATSHRFAVSAHAAGTRWDLCPRSPPTYYYICSRGYKSKHTHVRVAFPKGMRVDLPANQLTACALAECQLACRALRLFKVEPEVRPPHYFVSPDTYSKDPMRDHIPYDFIPHGGPDVIAHGGLVGKITKAYETLGNVSNASKFFADLGNDYEAMKARLFAAFDFPLFRELYDTAYAMCNSFSHMFSTKVGLFFMVAALATYLLSFFIDSPNLTVVRSWLLMFGGSWILASGAFTLGLFLTDDTVRRQLVAHYGPQVVPQGDNELPGDDYQSVTTHYCFLSNFFSRFCHIKPSYFLSKVTHFVEMCKTITHIERGVSSFERLFDKFLKFWDWFTDAAHIYIYGYSKHLKTNSVLALVKATLAVKNDPTKVKPCVYQFLMAELAKQIKICLNSDNAPLLNVLTNCRDDLEALQTVAIRHGFKARKGCVPPLVVNIVGESGVGKSTAVKALAGALSYALLGTEDLHSVHFRNSALEFWDNYANELITIFDDWGQIADSQANPSPDFISLICCKNIAEYVLPKADVDSKGQFIFTSPILLLSSNVKKVTQGMVKSITCLEAVERRLDIVIECTAFGEYQVTKLFGTPCKGLHLSNENLAPWVLKQFQHYYTSEFARVKDVERIFIDSMKDGSSPRWENIEAYNYFADICALRKDPILKLNTLPIKEQIFYRAFEEYYTNPSTSSNAEAHIDALEAKFRTACAAYNKTVPIDGQINCAVEPAEVLHSILSHRVSPPRPVAFLHKQGEWTLVHPKVLSPDSPPFTDKDKEEYVGEDGELLDVEYPIEYPIKENKHEYVINDCNENIAVYTVPATLDPTMNAPIEGVDNVDILTLPPSLYTRMTTKMVIKAYKPHEMCEVVTDACPHVKNFYAVHTGGKDLDKETYPWIRFTDMAYAIEPIQGVGAASMSFCPFCYTMDHNVPLKVFLQWIDPDDERLWATFIAATPSSTDPTIVYSPDDLAKPVSLTIPPNVSILYVRAMVLRMRVPDHVKSVITRIPYTKVISDFIESIAPKNDSTRALGILAALATMFAALYGGYKLYKMYNTITVEAHSGPYLGPVIKQNIERVVVTPHGGANLPLIKEEVCASLENHPHFAPLFVENSNSADNTARDITKKITGQLARGYLETGVCLANLLFLDGQTFLMIGHSMVHMKDSSVIHFVFPQKGITMSQISVPWKNCKFMHVKDSTLTQNIDLVMVRMPQKDTLPYMSNIRKYFLHIPDIMQVENRKAIMITIDCTASGEVMIEDLWKSTMPFLNGLGPVQIHHKQMKYDMPLPGGSSKQIIAPEYVQYEHVGRPGSCGSPCIATWSKLPFGRRIFGVHFGGTVSGGYGLSLILSKEQLDRVDAEFALVDPTPPLSVQAHCGGGYTGPSVVNSFKVVLPKKGNVEIVLNFSPVIVPNYRNMESSIVPSPIGRLQVLPILKAPAVLRPQTIDGETVDPMSIALHKMLHRAYKVDEKYLEQAFQSYLSKILACHRIGVLRRLLTMEEAAFGIPDDIYLCALNKKTSPGYPFKHDRPGKGKMNWINFDTKEITPELRALVDKRIECGKQGEAVEAIFEDHLKDEKRPFAKVEALKSRLFSAAPLDLTLAMRMYFGAFISWMMHNRLDNESAVGINPTSIEWDKLAKLLLQYGPAVLGGDFSNIDGTEQRPFLWLGVEVVNAWYDDGPENALVRKAIWLVVIAALHLNNGFFYSVYAGNPSGNLMTTFINIIYICLLMRYIYYVELGKTKLDPIDFAFDRKVSLMVFGDDNIMGVAPEVHFFFNPEVVRAGCASIGMTYTDERKDEGPMVFRTLEEVTFLKRSFYRDPQLNVYLGRLDLDTILEIPNWCYKDTNINELPLAIECALRELALYDTPTFKKWSQIILRACRKCKYPIVRFETRTAILDSLLESAPQALDMTPYY